MPASSRSHPSLGFALAGWKFSTCHSRPRSESSGRNAQNSVGKLVPFTTAGRAGADRLSGSNAPKHDQQRAMEIEPGESVDSRATRLGGGGFASPPEISITARPAEQMEEGGMI